MTTESKPQPLAALTVQNPGSAVSTTASAAFERAQAIVIRNDAEYQSAADELKAIKAKAAEIEGQRKTLKKPIDDAASAVQAFFRGPLEFLSRAESLLKGKLLTYQQEQERKRRAEQARLDEEARLKREKIEQQAARAAAAGKAEKAEALQIRAATVVAPIIQADPPKVAGLSGRDNWQAECNDLMALARAVAEGKVPPSYILPNDKVLGAQARTLKSEFICPGVRVWNDRGLAARAAAG